MIFFFINSVIITTYIYDNLLPDLIYFIIITIKSMYLYNTWYISDVEILVSQEGMF